MKYNNLLFFILVFLVSCVALKEQGTAEETIFARELYPYGRTAINDEDLELISSASHFSFSFEGTECKVFASLANWQENNYLQYELDGHGVYQKRIRINKGDALPITITASRESKHTVVIYKATEAHTGPIFIQKIVGKNVSAVKPPSAPLIEFIGNSITCGAASDPSEVPCGQGEYHDQHNAAMAYGPRVARVLKTNFLLSSVSGIGIYRNWNSDGPTMQQVYEKTDFQTESNRLWNFKTYQPAVVSIALGTNDFSAGDGKKLRQTFDSASFVSNYIRFVQLVKSKYPSAQIALLSSPMMNGNSRELLQNCLITVKQNIDAQYTNDKPIAIHFFKPMQARGCTGHPSVEDHKIMADEFIPFYKALLQ